MKHFFKSVLVLFIFSMTFGQLIAQCSYTGPVAPLPAGVGPGSKFGQYFQLNGTCPSGSAITDITWNLRNINNPVVNMEVFSGQSFDAADLLYTQSNMPLPPDNGDGTYTYTFDTPLSYNANESFTIIFTMVSGSFIAEFSGGNPVSPGTAFYTAGSTPIFNSSNDYYFIVGVSESAPVPTMGEWALIIFALIIMSMGVVTVMRFQKERNRQLAKA